MEEQQIRQESYATEISQLSFLKNYIGKELGVSEWTTISQNQIDTFARTTDDNQWIHVNPALAKKHSPYKKPIAHGFLILSLASKFCYETVKLMDVGMGVNYGLDKVRFMNATPVGSLVRARVSLISTDDVTGGLRYKMKLIFELKGQEKPACVAEFIALAYVDASKKNKKSTLTNNSQNLDELKSKSVLFKKEGDIAIVTLNRPEKYNAVNDDLVNGINESIAKVQKDGSIRAMVITGAGKGFCSGADLVDGGWPKTKGLSSGEATFTNMENAFNPLVKAITQSNKPVITAINGIAAGGGVGLALCGDIVIASKSAKFKLVFGPNLGIISDVGASWFVPNLIGRARANGMGLLGDDLSAELAKEWGLIWDCVPDDQLITTANEIAERIADGPIEGLKAIVKAHDKALSGTLSEQLDYEKETQRVRTDSREFKEGVSAFVEKRKPNFRDLDQ